MSHLRYVTFLFAVKTWLTHFITNSIVIWSAHNRLSDQCLWSMQVVYQTISSASILEQVEVEKKINVRNFYWKYIVRSGTNLKPRHYTEGRVDIAPDISVLLLHSAALDANLLRTPLDLNLFFFQAQLLFCEVNRTKRELYQFYIKILLFLCNR